jgi:DNA-binding XRE family transcriptional regulator
MVHSLEKILSALPLAERKRIEKRATELISEELSLRALRKAMGQTQAQLARDMGVGQDTISRYERRSDMLLSTLREYVRAMGGDLKLIAEFPNRPPVRIQALSDLADD